MLQQGQLPLHFACRSPSFDAAAVAALISAAPEACSVADKASLLLMLLIGLRLYVFLGRLEGCLYTLLQVVSVQTQLCLNLSWPPFQLAACPKMRFALCCMCGVVCVRACCCFYCYCCSCYCLFMSVCEYHWFAEAARTECRTEMFHCIMLVRFHRLTLHVTRSSATAKALVLFATNLGKYPCMWWLKTPCHSRLLAVCCTRTRTVASFVTMLAARP